MIDHIPYMQRAIELAKLGEGHTSPNPIVGSVIVSSEGKIIGEGWHKRCGEAHAEVNAIASVADPEQLKTSTIYVTLEPCSHWGKTPPCADLIIQKQIPRVVIGTVDPNQKVCGEGINRMRRSGIEVVIGVLEAECQQINRPFFTAHNLKRPYILLKWAQTADGYIDIVRDKGTATKWFTGWLNKLVVHKQRSLFDAIAVGTTTAIMDNPELTTREYFGKNPIRVTFDRELKLDPELRIFNDQATTILFTIEQNREKAKEKFRTKTNVVIEALDYQRATPPQVVEILAGHKIQSLIIEGGEKLLQSFIDHRLYDNILVFKSSQTLAQVHHTTVAEAVAAPRYPDHTQVIEGRVIGNCTVELR